LEQYSVAVPRVTKVKICDFNTVHTNGRRHFSDIPSVDLVVTSPPYGDSGTTVAYAQFSWMSNVWLGLDDRPPGALDREMMGGRKTSVESFGCPAMDSAISAIANVDEKRANEVMHFYHEYHQSIRNVAPHIKQGGHACFVVGNRIVKGTQLPTDQFTTWAFEQEGFEHITTYVRDIPNKRMPSRNSPTNKAGVTHSTMVHEFIVVCRKL
jgi:DNA modification methylase